MYHETISEEAPTPQPQAETLNVDTLKASANVSQHVEVPGESRQVVQAADDR